MVDDNVIEEGNNRDDIGLQGFDFNCFDEDKEGVGREGLSEYPYLLILMEIWHGDWNNSSKRTYMKVDEDNGKAVGMVNGRY